ncbi:hypothetical protein FRC10_006776 [Ceratobasidium sp. 414]|nr:hypothetical protein FRC10_006776 [Ceratobasidium sp. 414]
MAQANNYVVPNILRANCVRERTMLHSGMTDQHARNNLNQQGGCDCGESAHPPSFQRTQCLSIPYQQDDEAVGVIHSK